MSIIFEIQAIQRKTGKLVGFNRWNVLHKNRIDEKLIDLVKKRYLSIWKYTYPDCKIMLSIDYDSCPYCGESR